VEPLIASYYRSLYFNNSETQEPLPESLRKLHIFTHRRCQYLGLRVGKAEVLTTFYFWMAATGEGRKFAQHHPDLQGLFGGLDDELEEVENDEDEAVPMASSNTAVATKPAKVNRRSRKFRWADVTPGSAVQVNIDGQTVSGTFDSVALPWIKVVLPTSPTPKSVRPKDVTLSGA